MKRSVITPEMVDKMKTLRDQGVPNSLIAKELGVHYGTVIKHIGKQPTMLHAPHGAVCAYVTDLKAAPQTSVPLPAISSNRPSSLHIVAQTRILDGMYYQFTVNSFGKITLRPKDPDKMLSMDKQTLEAYIVELMDAYSELCECVK